MSSTINAAQFLDETPVTLEWLRDIQKWVYDEEMHMWFSDASDRPTFGSYMEMPYCGYGVLRLGQEVFRLDSEPVSIGRFLAMQYALDGKRRDPFGNIMDEQYFARDEADEEE